MEFLHYECDLTPDDVVEVSLDKQAHVRLMTDVNFALYRRGRRYSYTGGLAKVSPVRLTAPRVGRWHVVIDLAGYRGRVRASVRVLSAAGCPAGAW